MHRIIAIGLVACVAGSAAAQGVCPSGRRVPDLGYGFASCHDCISVMIRNGSHIPRFTGEPALYQIRTDGPAAGKLSEGDTLIDVDGLAITTEDAAMRLAEFRPGTMRLTVRRNGATRSVAITPLPVCVGGLPDETARTLDSLARVRARQQYAVGVISREQYERAMGRHELADSLARVDAEQAYRVGAISREAYERAMGRYEIADSLARENARLRYDAGVITRDEYERTIGRPRADSATTVRRRGSFGSEVAVPLGGFGRFEFRPRDMEVRFGSRTRHYTFSTQPSYQWVFGSPANAAAMADTMRFRDPTRPAGQTTWTLGVGLLCTRCGIEELANGRRRWTFSAHPMVDEVEAGGVADRLGLRRGDTLRRIDGLELTTPAGGERLGSLAPGRSFKLEWAREGGLRSATFTFDSIVRPFASANEPARLSQAVGTARVEVRGPGATWSQDPRTGELRIRVDSVTITVRPPQRDPPR